MVTRLGRVPRFYFHLCNGGGFAEDEEGTEHQDLAAARANAIRGLRDIMAGELQQGDLNLGSFIEIEDENHQLLMTVPFEEAVKVGTIKGARPSRGR
jgi:hypothetical protein